VDFQVELFLQVLLLKLHEFAVHPSVSHVPEIHIIIIIIIVIIAAAAETSDIRGGL
jgi:hypothetical protein